MTTIANFGKVSDSIYRGAQPTISQFAELRALGVSTVIDLREDLGREQEAAACAALGILHISVPIGNQNIPILGELGILPPTREQVATIMRNLKIRTPLVVEFPEKYFIHCAHGRDRTGAVVAAYRMLRDGWTNQQAMAEARAYHINPLQILIEEFIENFKVEDYA